MTLLGWHPFAGSQLQIYVGFVALLLNLLVAVVLTPVLRARRAAEGADATAPADYHADEGTAGLRPVAAAAEGAAEGAAGADRSAPLIAPCGPSVARGTQDRLGVTSHRDGVIRTGECVSIEESVGRREWPFGAAALNMFLQGCNISSTPAIRTVTVARAAERAEVSRMLDIGPGVSDDESLLVVVDRLGAAGADRVAARAHEQVRRAVLARMPLPGLHRLTTNLVAVDAGELPPSPRHPADEPGSVVAAVRDNPLMILDDVEPAEVAAAVAALVDDGRRVIVTAEDTAALGAIRSMLPAAVTDRIVGALPTLAPADVHRLRGLLATSTPARRARTTQHLPDLAVFPAPDAVAPLCVTAVRSSAPGVEVIADVLGGLDADRRGAVSAIAQGVQRSLRVLSAHSEPWIWDLLADLVVGRRRSEFDRLVLSTAQALSTIDDGRGDPPVRATGRLPEGSVDALVAYLDFLDTGGRARSYFRSSVQRDVEPVLHLLRVGDREPATADELRIVLTHFELGERLVAVDADCATLDLPTPLNPDELTALSQVLTDIGTAARSVAALRHDVLFLHPGSPVSVPDVASAEQFANAVLDYDENGSPREAAERLDALADTLSALAPAQATAPEHTRAVAALRARDPGGYAAAVDELVGAHLAQRDERRTAALLAGLGSESLARAWTHGSAGAPVRFGLVWFTPTERLLTELPPPDRADVVVVLDAGRVGIDRALACAAAPRMLAVAGRGSRSGGSTLLGLLSRACALVIRGRSSETSGRVVPLPAGGRVVPVPRGKVEQAGA